MKLVEREIHIRYSEGIADSRLRIPAAKSDTMRNMNTITDIADMAVNS